MEDKNILFVGDIHEKLDIVTHILDDLIFSLDFPIHEVVLVGDIFDSWDEKPGRALAAAKRIMYFTHPITKVTLLKANHEVQYYWPEERCSGWHSITEILFDEIKNDWFRLSKWFWSAENALENGHAIICTHAGLNANFLQGHVETGTQRGLDASVAIEWLQGWSRIQKHEQTDREHPFFHCGRKSGGRYMYGGILWSRPQEGWESIPGVTQIFGHTSYRKGITPITPQDWGIDCLDGCKELLLLREKKLEIIKF